MIISNKREYWQGYNEELGNFESFLDLFIVEHIIDRHALEMVQYCLGSGGKRIRPMLLIKTAQVNNAPVDKTYRLAAALECIHTYSLVHDDLPAMDNDDFRRGKPSMHRAYGEANAILTGDILLNLAYELIFTFDGINDNDLTAARIISSYSGVWGMIKGQLLDVNYHPQDDIYTLEEKKQLLYDTHRLKTSSLLIAAILGGAALGGADYDTIARLKIFAESAGVYYQILDDLRDVEDEKDKLTYPQLYGVAGAKKQAEKFREIAQNSLNNLGEEYSYLQNFLDSLE